MNKSRVFRRWSIGVALSVTVAVLAVLIWNCAAPPGTSESAASGFSAPTGSVGASATKTYVDPECGYSFDYPASWRLDPQTGALREGVLSTVMVFDPQGTGDGEMSYTVLLVQVEDSGPAFTESMLPGIQTDISASVAGLTQSGDVQVVVPVAATEVGGMKGFSVTLRDSRMDPSTTSSMYYLYRGTLVYTLGVQAAGTDWEKNQAVFDDFIGTFEPAD